MSHVDFWKTFFDFDEGDAGPSDEIKVTCPFHAWNVGKDDENPSMSINLETGKYKCFSCPEDGWLRPAGDAAGFTMSYFDVAFPVAKGYIAAVLDGTIDAPLPISEENVLAWQDALQNAEKIREKLSERGIDANTLRVHELGWDGKRVTIPIRNYRGDVVNVRRYNMGDKQEKKVPKMVSLSPLEFKSDDQVYTVRYGEPRLFPTSSLVGATNICSIVHLGNKSGIPVGTDAPEVFLMAGEWDCMLARQWGLDAYTVTNGEGVWREKWNAMFHGCKVYIVYDMDRPGKLASQSVAESMLKAGIDVRVVHLPLSGDKAQKDKDFTDWILKASPSSKSEVHERLVGFSKPVSLPEPKTDGGIVKGDTDVHEVSLMHASYDPEYQGRRTRIRATVVGKDLTPYTVIKNATVNCDKMDADNPLCKGCTVNFASGTLDVEIGPDQGILNFIKCPDDQMWAKFRDIVGIPGKCPKWTAQVHDSQNVEQVFVSPEVQSGYDSLSDEHTLQDAYYVYSPGEKRLEANATYVMEGIRTTEPWKQHVVHIVDTITPVQDTVEAFTLTEKVKGSLVELQPNPGQSLASLFDSIAEGLTRDVTHIYGRHDLVVGILLTFCSVQRFRFQGQPVDNGLVETLVIGDTRTGKSETAARLGTFFRLGGLVTGEATTFAGLVGGLQAGVDGHWTVTWGQIPRHNGKQLTIDEASGLHTAEIERMSGVRSSRVAELNKIVQARTNARTRLLWLSNPRANRPLRSYSHGVEAVPELIGKPEDVARFDLVLSCASGEVPDTVINQVIPNGTGRVPVGGYIETLPGSVGEAGSEQPEDHDGNGQVDVQASGGVVRGIQGETFRDVILWAWSRRMHHIQFTDGATTATLRAALDMGRRYSSEIPIVESANQRIKIARLAVAAACLSASTDDTYENVIVTEDHVRFAHEFMDAAYSKPSLDYSGFSEKEKGDEHIALREGPTIRIWSYKNWAVSDFIFGMNVFRARDLEEQMNVDTDRAKDIIHKLASTRMIVHTKDGYRKTAAFVTILKDLREEKRNGRDRRDVSEESVPAQV